MKNVRPPKHLRTLKHRTIRSDGMMFWGYMDGCPNGELWVTKERFEEKKRKAKEYSKSYTTSGKAAKQNARYRKRYPEKTYGYIKKWVSKNRDKINANERKRYKENHTHRIAKNLRALTSQALRGRTKKANSSELLGCDWDFLKIYLENRFKEGMTWENQGSAWHIDHIIPLASFDLTKKSEQKKGCHYTNLQPLWAKENLSKGAKLPTEQINLL